MLDLFKAPHRDPASCVISVDGEEITDLYPFLVSVDVSDSREMATTAELIFDSRRDENGEWVVQDAGLFVPWRKIKIEATFGDVIEEVMRGYVVTVDADYPSDPGSASVRVRCQDDSLALDRSHRRKTWGGEAPTTDQVILTTILQGAGLLPHPENAAGSSGLALQQDTTDIRFLRQRARANAYELFFREGQVYFGPMRLDAQPQATVMVYAGPDTNATGFRIEDRGHQPDSVTVELPDPEGAGVISRTVVSELPSLGTEPSKNSDGGHEDFDWRLSRVAESDEETAVALARDRVDKAAMSIAAEGELDGSLYGHVLLSGVPVGVDGIGTRYGGIYYVDKVDHRFDDKGYLMNFRLLRNAVGDNLNGGGGLLDAIL